MNVVIVDAKIISLRSSLLCLSELLVGEECMLAC